MARSRNIKHSYPQLVSVCAVSREARLLRVLLWTVADDAGRLVADLDGLAERLYPRDLDAPLLLPSWLDELEGQGSVERYSIDGRDYARIVDWQDEQYVQHPGPSRLPRSPCEPAIHESPAGIHEKSGMPQNQRLEGATKFHETTAGIHENAKGEADQELGDPIGIHEGFEERAAGQTAPDMKTRQSNMIRRLRRIGSQAEDDGLFVPALRAWEFEARCFGILGNARADKTKIGPPNAGESDIPRVTDVVP